MTTPAKQPDVLRHGTWRSIAGIALTCTLALLVSASLGATPAQSSHFRRCADVVFNSNPGGLRAINVRTRGVSCATARRLVRRDIRTNCNSATFCRVGTWTCRRPRKLVMGSLTDCRRPNARVVYNLVGGS